jgi:hypothetical protein
VQCILYSNIDGLFHYFLFCNIFFSCLAHVVCSDRLTNTILFSLSLCVCVCVWSYIYLYIHLTCRSSFQENLWPLTFWVWLTSLLLNCHIPNPTENLHITCTCQVKYSPGLLCQRTDPFKKKKNVLLFRKFPLLSQFYLNSWMVVSLTTIPYFIIIILAYLIAWY